MFEVLYERDMRLNGDVDAEGNFTAQGLARIGAIERRIWDHYNPDRPAPPPAPWGHDGSCYGPFGEKRGVVCSQVFTTDESPGLRRDRSIIWDPRHLTREGVIFAWHDTIMRQAGRCVGEPIAPFRPGAIDINEFCSRFIRFARERFSQEIHWGWLPRWHDLWVARAWPDLCEGWGCPPFYLDATRESDGIDPDRPDPRPASMAIAPDVLCFNHSSCTRPIAVPSGDGNHYGSYRLAALTDFEPIA